ncbi:MAG: hypothetical protein AVDCRST_MAG71-2997, partial [uncultured Lysobacter sp.]
AAVAMRGPSTCDPATRCKGANRGQRFTAATSAVANAPVFKPI